MMVEKIIINPQKVRGLGNVFGEQDLEDLVNYNSNISIGTDTINGSEEKVFTMAYSIYGFSFYFNANSKHIYATSDGLLDDFSFDDGEKQLVMSTEYSDFDFSFDQQNKRIVVEVQ